MTKRKPLNKRAYISYPFFTDWGADYNRFNLAIECVVRMKYVPVCSSVYFMNQPTDLLVGDITKSDIASCEAFMMCFDEHMTDYMLKELEYAKSLNLPVTRIVMTGGKEG